MSNRRSTDKSGAQRKRPYRSPRLVKHGDLRRLTQGGGGNKREAGGVGAPKTKATGTIL